MQQKPGRNKNLTCENLAKAPGRVERRGGFLSRRIRRRDRYLHAAMAMVVPGIQQDQCPILSGVRMASLLAMSANGNACK